MRSEEDVKIKVVLPFLRALGCDDSDFNYEAKTGHGYVDIVLDKFPNRYYRRIQITRREELLALAEDRERIQAREALISAPR